MLCKNACIRCCLCNANQFKPKTPFERARNSEQLEPDNHSYCPGPHAVANMFNHSTVHLLHSGMGYSWYSAQASPSNSYCADDTLCNSHSIIIHVNKIAHAIRDSKKALHVLLAGKHDDALQCRHAGDVHAKQYTCCNNVRAANLSAAAQHDVHKQMMCPMQHNNT